MVREYLYGEVSSGSRTDIDETVCVLAEGQCRRIELRPVRAGEITAALRREATMISVVAGGRSSTRQAS